MIANPEEIVQIHKKAGSFHCRLYRFITR